MVVEYAADREKEKRSWRTDKDGVKLLTATAYSEIG
jgi:hypothetical protein